MDATSPAPEFPIGWCAACGRHVLTHTEYPVEGGERYLCVHCDRRLDGVSEHAREGELSGHGYALVEDYNCGNPNCGGGRCGRG
jgi:hypothetical protein